MGRREALKGGGCVLSTGGTPPGGRNLFCYCYWKEKKLHCMRVMRGMQRAATNWLTAGGLCTHTASSLHRHVQSQQSAPGQRAVQGYSWNDCSGKSAARTLATTPRCSALDGGQPTALDWKRHCMTTWWGTITAQPSAASHQGALGLMHIWYELVTSRYAHALLQRTTCKVGEWCSQRTCPESSQPGFRRMRVGKSTSAQELARSEFEYDTFDIVFQPDEAFAAEHDSSHRCRCKCRERHAASRCS
jgi:hypothetical protein